MKIENPYKPDGAGATPNARSDLLDDGFTEQQVGIAAIIYGEGYHSRDKVVDGLVEACRAVDSDIASYWDVHVLRISDRSWQLVKEAIAKAKP